MNELLEGSQPVAVGALFYAVAWLLWRYCLSPAREDVEAEGRAAALLGELLSEKERGQLARSGYLWVRSPGAADRAYRIPALTGWVDVFDGDRHVMRLCAQPSEKLPAADVVLMHKLMIEGNEQEYLRLANIRWMRKDWREVAMITRHVGGEVAKGGIYWSWSDGEFIALPPEGARLAGGRKDRYSRVPLPLVLIAAPLMGLAFALFLPLSGLLVLIPILAGKVREAVSAGWIGAAHMAGHRMQPGVSYLGPRPRSSNLEPKPHEEEQEGRLVDLAREIADRRWRGEQ